VEIQSHEEGAEIGDMYSGVVESLLDDNVLRVSMEVDEGHPPDYENVPYDSTDLAWVSFPASKAAPAPLVDQAGVNLHSVCARPALSKAAGYLIEVQSHDEGAEAGDMFPGFIESVDLGKKIIIVAFETDVQGQFDREEIAYTSPDVAWMSAPK